MDFTKTLITSIIASKDMPKVQVERELGPVLEIFLESFINKLAELELESTGLEQGCYKLVAGEFPLEIDPSNRRSVNIDYLLFNEVTNTFYFLELKTDSGSFKLSQHQSYIELIDRIHDESAAFLFAFLDKLNNKKYKKFYKSKVLEKLPEEYWHNIKDARLIYLSPEKLFRNNTRRSDKAMNALNNTFRITFKDLAEHNDIKHPLKNDWVVITEIMKALDEN